MHRTWEFYVLKAKYALELQRVRLGLLRLFDLLLRQPELRTEKCCPRCFGAVVLHRLYTVVVVVIDDATSPPWLHYTFGTKGR